MPETFHLEQNRKESKLLKPSESPNAEPELNETGPQALVDWIQLGNLLISSDADLAPEKKQATAKFFNSYREYLKVRFQHDLEALDKKMEGKKVLNDAELDSFFKHLITSELTDANLPNLVKPGGRLLVVPGEMQSALTESLKRTIKDVQSPEEVCRHLGVEFNEMEAVMLPTSGTRPDRFTTEQTTKTKDKAPITTDKNKLAELLPYLIAHVTGPKDIKVIEGSVKKEQMRERPYILVQIPDLNKQILICNQLGEGAFVSGQLRDISAYIDIDANKQKLRDVGLKPVTWDRQGKWLEKIKALLLDEVKDIAAIKAELLEKFPKSKDFLKIINSKDKFSVISRANVRILSGRASEGTPTNQDFIRCGMVIYGENEPNLVYALKLEQNDAEYFNNIIRHGLPEGVDYFLPESKHSEAQGEKFQGCPEVKDFIQRYLSRGINQDDMSGKLIEDLDFGPHIFVRIFAPAVLKARVEQLKQKFEGREEEAFNLNISATDFYKACAVLYSESKQFQYLLDLDDPQKLTAMIKGKIDYDLNKIYGLSSKIDMFPLKPEKLASFEEFWDKIIIKNRGSITDIGRDLNQKFGFGVFHFSEKMGHQLLRSKQKETTENRINFFESLKTVYPENKQLQYLIDINKKEKIIEMIRGGYDLSGLSYVNSPGGKAALQPRPYPDFQSFKEAFFADFNRNKVSKLLLHSIGIGTKQFVNKMGAGQDKNNNNIVRILEALKQVYPEANNEIQEMIDAKPHLKRAQKNK